MGGNKDNHVLKMVLTAIFAGMGFALSSVVWFPNMAPFQHFINVLAAVFVGPYWGFLAALITGILRMMTGRTALAVIGAVIGAFCPVSCIGNLVTSCIWQSLGKSLAPVF